MTAAKICPQLGYDASRPAKATGDHLCRNIRTLFNFEPPATDEEITASAVQFVRKLSGFTKPSKANEAAFDRAVEDVANAARDLLASLETASPPKNREEEAEKRRMKSALRFAGLAGQS